MKKITFTLLFICLIFLTSCSLVKRKVVFCNEFGDAIKVKEVSFGDLLEERDAPLKEGYSFTGWFNGDDKWNFKKDRVYKDIKLIANYEINTYRVFFDTDGGKTLLPLSYKYGERFVLPRITKDEFEFAWWVMDGEKCEFTQDMPSHDIYLKPAWFMHSAGWKINNSTLVAYKGSATEFRVPSFYAFDKEKKDLTIIGTCAFMNNKTLKKVEISEGISKIETFAFMECSMLENVILPNTLEEIGMQAFAYTKLKYIVIPSSVTKIDSSAFMGVDSDFVIYTNFNLRPSTWGEALTSNIKVYYEDEWEYNENGIPTKK